MGTCAYVGYVVLSLGEKMAEYSKRLELLWSLNTEDMRELFTTTWNKTHQLIKFIFCVSARVGEICSKCFTLTW